MSHVSPFAYREPVRLIPKVGIVAGTRLSRRRVFVACVAKQIDMMTQYDGAICMHACHVAGGAIEGLASNMIFGGTTWLENNIAGTGGESHNFGITGLCRSQRDLFYQ